MKVYVSILLIAVALTIVLSGCKTCYPCLADGENFDLPVAPNQSVTYVNDSNIQKTFSARLFGNWPADEYCGRVGSGSYGKCGAIMTGCLENTQDSLAICFKCSTGYNDNVEQNVTRHMGIARPASSAMWLISVKKGVGSPTENSGTIHKIDNISIGGNKYSDVFEYQNNYAGINECTNFVYSVKYGVLKFSIRLENSVENWVLVK